MLLRSGPQIGRVDLCLELACIWTDGEDYQGGSYIKVVGWQEKVLVHLSSTLEMEEAGGIAEMVVTEEEVQDEVAMR